MDKGSGVWCSILTVAKATFLELYVSGWCKSNISRLVSFLIPLWSQICYKLFVQNSGPTARIVLTVPLVLGISHLLSPFTRQLLTQGTSCQVPFVEWLIIVDTSDWPLDQRFEICFYSVFSFAISPTAARSLVSLCCGRPPCPLQVGLWLSYLTY